MQSALQQLAGCPAQGGEGQASVAGKGQLQNSALGGGEGGVGGWRLTVLVGGEFRNGLDEVD